MAKKNMASVTMPHVISGMPRRALPEDHCHLKCSGRCAFFGESMDPEARQENMKKQQAPSENSALAAVNSMLHLMGSSDSDNSDDEEATKKQAEAKEAAKEENEVAKKEAQDVSVKADTLHRVFTFARPVSSYSKVWREALVARPGHTVIIVQSTGSPNSWIAVRALGVTDIHVIQPRVPEHQLWHGLEVARDRFFQESMPATTAMAAAPAVPHGVTMQTQLQYISAGPCEEAGLFQTDPWEVHVSLESPTSGLDLVHTSVSALDSRLAWELAKHSLLFKTSSVSPMHLGIFTAVALQDSFAIPVSAVLFSRVGFLKQFLTKPGGQRFYDRLVCCQGIFHEGEATPLYAVLTGFGGELMHGPQHDHCNGGAKPANLKLSYDARVGFTAGFLSVTVCTHNRAGIAPGSELLLDYGDFFNMSVPFGARQQTINEVLSKQGRGGQEGGGRGAGEGRGSRRGRGGRGRVAVVAVESTRKSKRIPMAGPMAPTRTSKRFPVAPIRKSRKSKTIPTALSKKRAPPWRTQGLQWPRTRSRQRAAMAARAAPVTAARGNSSSSNSSSSSSSGISPAAAPEKTTPVTPVEPVETLAVGQDRACAVTATKPEKRKPTFDMHDHEKRPRGQGDGDASQGQIQCRAEQASSQGDNCGADVDTPPKKRVRARREEEKEEGDIGDELPDNMTRISPVEECGLVLSKLPDGRVMLKAPGRRKIPSGTVLFTNPHGKVRSQKGLNKDEPGWQPSSVPCLPIRVASNTTVVKKGSDGESKLMSLELAWKEVIHEAPEVSMYPFVLPSSRDEDKVTFTLKDTLFYLPPAAEELGEHLWSRELLQKTWSSKSAKVVLVWGVHKDVFGPWYGSALVTSKNLVLRNEMALLSP